MEWWQLALFGIPISIVGGVLIGISIAYLIRRFVYKDRIPFLKVPSLLFRRNPKILTSRELNRTSNDKPSEHPEVHEQTDFPIPELLSEFEHNCKIVAEFSGNNLLPLQADVWEAQKQLADKLPTTLRNQLLLIYSDINSLNRMVFWYNQLSTDLSYQSSILTREYSKLLTRIADNLKKIKQQLENNAF